MPGRRQGIIWIGDGILLTGPLRTKFRKIFIAIHAFSFKKMHLTMSSVKWRPCCHGLNVLERLASYWLHLHISLCWHSSNLGILWSSLRLLSLSFLDIHINLICLGVYAPLTPSNWATASVGWLTLTPTSIPQGVGVGGWVGVGGLWQNYTAFALLLGENKICGWVHTVFWIHHEPAYRRSLAYITSPTANQAEHEERKLSWCTRTRHIY